MKRSAILLSIIGLIWIFLFTGCRKDLNPQPTDPGGNVNSMLDLKVSSTFNWQTTREVTLTVGLYLPNSATNNNRINVYDGDPYNGGQQIFTGLAGNDFQFIAKIRIATAFKQLYLELIPSIGARQIVAVDVMDNINYTFTEITASNKSANVVEPDCSGAPAGKILSGSGAKTISDGATWYVTDLPYSGAVTIKKGTLQICGTFTGTIDAGDNQDNNYVVVTSNGTINSSLIKLAKNSLLTIYGTGSVTASVVQMTQNAKLTNYGIITINSGIEPKDLIQNFGTMTVNGHFNMNGNSSRLYNEGILTINNKWTADNGFSNIGGKIEVFEDMNCNSGTDTNTCMIVVHGNFLLNNAKLRMYTGYLKVDGETKTQGGQSVLLLKDQSMLSTNDLTVNQDINGEGTRNEIKVTNDLRFDGPRQIIGPIEVAQTSGTIANGGYPANFAGGSTFVSFANITNTIPQTECNPDGNFPPTPPGPNNNYFTGTSVWEDLWPGTGDYDINDLVLYYKYNLITNNQNKVTHIVAKFYVRAAGASLKNGFGFQINNLLPSQIASVTGYNIQESYISLNSNGTEANQSKAVIIAIDNIDNVIHRGGSSPMFNTLRNYPTGTADTVTVTIQLTTPLLTTEVGTAPFNPFLIKNMNRGVEIHMPDYIPTSLASSSYFGTMQDDSDPGIGRYYKTSLNLPWCLDIPVNFDYPFEYVDITQAHLHFAAWAQSGGTLFDDWYKDLPGYRNDDNIWHP